MITELRVSGQGLIASAVGGLLLGPLVATLGATSALAGEPPDLRIMKEAERTTIPAGDEASFVVTVRNEGPGTAHEVTVGDELPVGLDWSFLPLAGESPAACESSADDTGTIAFSCALGDLVAGDSMAIRVFAPTDEGDCGQLVNAAWTEALDHDRVTTTAAIDVECPIVPTLTIEKAADTENVIIGGGPGPGEPEPTVINWSLTHTLSNGPVTMAVIRDELPIGLVYLEGSASHGGVFDPATNTLTWTFASLTTSGSVNFATMVDPATISRVAPTRNVAVISSDQTPEDQGEDVVTVSVEPPPLGGNPTPNPTPGLPDTAIVNGAGVPPASVPVELMALVSLGSAGALALRRLDARSGRHASNLGRRLR